MIACVLQKNVGPGRTCGDGLPDVVTRFFGEAGVVPRNSVDHDRGVGEDEWGLGPPTAASPRHKILYCVDEGS